MEPERKSGWAQPHRWVIIGVAVVLVVVGLITYGFEHADAEADRKADELIQRLADAGLPVPANHDTVTRVLGTDGGPVCDDPGSALRKALLDQRLTNGGAFVGQRPIRGDGEVLRGGLIVLEVYCPDQVDALRDRIQDYRVDDVDGE
jgi:hypothetical protein